MSKKMHRCSAGIAAGIGAFKLSAFRVVKSAFMDLFRFLLTPVGIPSLSEDFVSVGYVEGAIAET